MRISLLKRRGLYKSGEGLNWVCSYIPQRLGNHKDTGHSHSRILQWILWTTGCAQSTPNGVGRFLWVIFTPLDQMINIPFSNAPSTSCHRLPWKESSNRIHVCQNHSCIRNWELKFKTANIHGNGMYGKMTQHLLPRLLTMSKLRNKWDLTRRDSNRMLVFTNPDFKWCTERWRVSFPTFVHLVTQLGHCPKQ